VICTIKQQHYATSPYSHGKQLTDRLPCGNNTPVLLGYPSLCSHPPLKTIPPSPPAPYKSHQHVPKAAAHPPFFTINEKNLSSPNSFNLHICEASRHWICSKKICKQHGVIKPIPTRESQSDCLRGGKFVAGEEGEC
jgi:hypothetical protein